jgi:hypothetical protein
MKKHIPIVVVISLMILGVELGQYLREKNAPIPNSNASGCELVQITVSE